jgi:hypothetical protein
VGLDVGDDAEGKQTAANVLYRFSCGGLAEGERAAAKALFAFLTLLDQRSVNFARRNASTGVKWGGFGLVVLLWLVEPPQVFKYIYGSKRYEKA